MRRDGPADYLRPDGKTQVTVRYEDGVPVSIEKVLISTGTPEHVDSATTIRNDLLEHVAKQILPAEMYDDDALFTKENFLVNPSASVIGRSRATRGLTGRKIIVDTYGVAARHGGGAFRRKTRRRWIIRRPTRRAGGKNVVAAGLAERARCRWPTRSAWPTRCR